MHLRYSPSRVSGSRCGGFARKKKQEASWLSSPCRKKAIQHQKTPDKAQKKRTEELKLERQYGAVEEWGAREVPRQQSIDREAGRGLAMASPGCQRLHLTTEQAMFPTLAHKPVTAPKSTSYLPAGNISTKAMSLVHSHD